MTLPPLSKIALVCPPLPAVASTNQPPGSTSNPLNTSFKSTGMCRTRLLSGIMLIVISCFHLLGLLQYLSQPFPHLFPIQNKTQETHLLQKLFLSVRTEIQLLESVAKALFVACTPVRLWRK